MAVSNWVCTHLTRRKSPATLFIIGFAIGLLVAPYVLPSLSHLIREEPVIHEGDIVIVEDSQYLDTVAPLIKSANESVHVIMFVIKYDPGDSDDPVNDLLNLLAEARSRGVDVKVLVDEETADSYPQTIDFLKEHEISVRLDKSSGITTHAKVVIIDGKFVVVGSHNWTESALRYNHEVSALIRSGTAAGLLEDYFNSLWNEGREV